MNNTTGVVQGEPDNNMVDIQLFVLQLSLSARLTCSECGDLTVVMQAARKKQVICWLNFQFTDGWGRVGRGLR